MVKKYEKFTRFVFTLYRPTPGKISLLDNIPGLILCFYGDEIGPESKTNHLQGYIELHPRYPINLFKLLNILKGYYAEPAKLSRLHNYIYCSKCCVTSEVNFHWSHGKEFALDMLKEN